MKTYILKYHFANSEKINMSITRANSPEEAKARLKEYYFSADNLVVYDIRAFTDESLETTNFVFFES